MKGVPMEQPMSKTQAEALLDRFQTDLMPELRRAMLVLAATSALIGALVALIFFSFLVAAR